MFNRLGIDHRGENLSMWLLRIENDLMEHNKSGLVCVYTVTQI